MKYKAAKGCEDTIPAESSFFKVMFGDRFDQILYIPPKFVPVLKPLLGKKITLEDVCGKQWTVKLTYLKGTLAIEEGWNEFALDHDLKFGHFVVFHYYGGKRFVVQIWDKSACEKRDFNKNKKKRASFDDSNGTAKNGARCKIDKSFVHKKSASTFVSSGPGTSQTEADVNDVHAVPGTTRIPRPAFETHQAREACTEVMHPKWTCNIGSGNMPRYPGAGFGKESQGEAMVKMVIDNTSSKKIRSNVMIEELLPDADISPVRRNESGLFDKKSPKKEPASGVVFSGDSEDDHLYKERNNSGENNISGNLSGTYKLQPAKDSDNSSNLSTRVPINTLNFGVAGGDAKLMKPVNSSSLLVEEGFGRPPSARAATVSCLVASNKQTSLELPEPLPSFFDRTGEMMNCYNKVVFLRDPSKKLWPVRYHEIPGVNILSDGWIFFSEANNIQPGDECVFRLETEDRFEVRIIRK